MEESAVGLNTLTAMSPDEMPEIPRELTMLRGSVTSLHNVVNDLLGRLGPITDSTPIDDSSENSVAPFPCTSEIGKMIRDIQNEVSTIEGKVGKAYHRVRI